MTKFTYTALVPGNGREEEGAIESADRAAAIAQLKARGLAPVRLEPEPAARRQGPRAFSRRPGGRRAPEESPEIPKASRRIRPRFGRPMSRAHLVLFTRQLATLVNAGLPLARGLAVLQRQERSPGVRAVLEEMGAIIGAGRPLSDGLLRHPRLFDSLYVNMVKAGEARGGLGAALDRLALYLEKAARLKSKVAGAMIYPVVVMAVAGGILTVLMVFVVPKFEQIFSGLLKGQPLPALTRALLEVSAVVQGRAGWLIAVGVLAAVGSRYLRRTRGGRWAWDWTMIHGPLVGDLVLKAAVARFSRTLGSLLANGVPILDALVITRAASGNLLVEQALDHVHDRIKQGEAVARSLEDTGIFPGLVTGMIQVGEETGALPEMLGRIADTYDEEVDQAVAGLTAAIEPVMIVLMALVVGVIVVALFLPIVSVIQHLQ